TAALAGAFQVVPGSTAADALQVGLTVPALARYNSQTYLVVSYDNTGNTDVEAPLLTVTADNALLGLAGQRQAGTNSVQFLGINTGGPAGVLPPGYHGTQVVYFTSTIPITEQLIHFQVQVADDSQPMDWASFKSALQPSTIPNDAWDAIYGNFTAN